MDSNAARKRKWEGEVLLSAKHPKIGWQGREVKVPNEIENRPAIEASLVTRSSGYGGDGKGCNGSNYFLLTDVSATSSATRPWPTTTLPQSPEMLTKMSNVRQRSMLPTTTLFSESTLRRSNKVR